MYVRYTGSGFNAHISKDIILTLQTVIFVFIYQWLSEPSAAIKAPVNVFLTQFPVINYGCAKSGAPISYVRTDGLSVEGMECLTDLEKLPNYAWHSSYHSFQNEVAKAQVKNPDLVRYVHFTRYLLVCLRCALCMLKHLFFFHLY